MKHRVCMGVKLKFEMRLCSRRISKRQGKIKAKIPQLFNVQAIDDVHAAVAQYFYAHSISFNVAKGPRFQEMVYTTNHTPKGCVAAKHERLRTTLFDKESRTDQALAAIRYARRTYGVAVVSDGWSNVKNW
ncbi:hypothetical protein AMTR_s00022p00136540 [Amborella trichopoda]|uniref:DUF659 domain-containing protein n=1 Tax=Amborella trichopoda TaxID=13333 RepID=W1PTZ1_AMBTC|nr:hypothetical protein AMTR_s00022p00136540 [Amborella trichopoda]